MIKKLQLKENKYLVALFIILLIVDIILITARKHVAESKIVQQQTWPMQSIDTVKYSRDLARQHESDTEYETVIDSQVKNIAATGANYIAIGTPYDDEFVPYLTRWVKAARNHNLKVWFRGNFSGWEGWFDYPKIGREDHKKMLTKFIQGNGNLFEDGDIFTACTECENGGPGDPRRTGNVEEYRKFLIDEYQLTRRAFSQVDKNVTSNYFPMNFDVALLVMDADTTRSLGGKVVIDHYVATPEILANTIKALEDSSGGKVILGEFGAPIPDIHGKMTDSEQAGWIEQALSALAKDPNVAGVNYWTSYGGSTRLWEDNGTATPATSTLKSYFHPLSLAGTVQNEAGYYVRDAEIRSSLQTTKSDSQGIFHLSYVEKSDPSQIEVKAAGYKPAAVQVTTDNNVLKVTLQKEKENLFFKLEKFIYKYLGL